MKIIASNENLTWITRCVGEVEKGYIEPQDKAILMMSQKDSLRDMRKREKKTLFLIYQWLDEGAFKKIVITTNFKQA